MLYLFGNSLYNALSTGDYKDNKKDLILKETKDYVYIDKEYNEDLCVVKNNLEEYLNKEKNVFIKSFDEETYIAEGTDNNRYHLAVEKIKDNKIKSLGTISSFLLKRELTTRDLIYFDIQKGEWHDLMGGDALHFAQQSREDVRSAMEFQTKLVNNPNILYTLYSYHKQKARFRDNLRLSIDFRIIHKSIDVKHEVLENEGHSFFRFCTGIINSAEEYFEKICGLKVKLVYDPSLLKNKETKSKSKENIIDEVEDSYKEYNFTKEHEVTFKGWFNETLPKPIPTRKSIYEQIKDEPYKTGFDLPEDSNNLKQESIKASEPDTTETGELPGLSSTRIVIKGFADDIIQKRNNNK